MGDGDNLNFPARRVRALEFTDSEDQDGDELVKVYSLDVVTKQVFRRKMDEDPEIAQRLRECRHQMTLLKSPSGKDEEVQERDLQDWLENLKLRAEKAIASSRSTASLSSTGRAATAFRTKRKDGTSSEGSCEGSPMFQSIDEDVSRKEKYVATNPPAEEAQPESSGPTKTQRAKNPQRSKPTVDIQKPVRSKKSAHK